MSATLPYTDPPPGHDIPSPSVSPITKRPKIAPTSSPPKMASSAKAAPPSNTPAAPPTTKVEDCPPLLIKKLSPKGRTPTRGSAFAAGYDLYSAQNTVIPKQGKTLVDTDIAAAVPAGTCILRPFLHQTLTPSVLHANSSEHSGLIAIFLERFRWPYSTPKWSCLKTLYCDRCGCHRCGLSGAA